MPIFENLFIVLWRRLSEINIPEFMDAVRFWKYNRRVKVLD